MEESYIEAGIHEREAKTLKRGSLHNDSLREDDVAAAAAAAAVAVVAAAAAAVATEDITTAAVGCTVDQWNPVQDHSSKHYQSC
jgi:hypothetical protein